jgi:hypothetical protein
MSKEILRCPKCGEIHNLHVNWDYANPKPDGHLNIESVLCNECGKFFEVKEKEGKFPS